MTYWEKNKKIILKIISSKKTNIKLLVENLHVGRNTIQRDIDYLIKLKIIERIGSKKTGYYANLKYDKIN